MSGIKRTKLGLTIATLVATSAATAGVAGGGVAGAAETRSRDSVASFTATTAAATAGVEYWTRKRMANAKPYQVRPGASTGMGQGARTAASPTGPRVTVPPAAGGLGSNVIAPQAAAALARPYTNLPDRLNVKVFFTGATGGNFVCSGTIVNSSTKRMVSTAGHCVSDGVGGWHTNVVVVPGYSSQCNGCGDAPFGRWPARVVTTLSEWHLFSNLKQDVGYIVTKDRNRTRIVNQLGGHGTKFNVARSQQFRSYGYPQAAPFDGFNQYVCPSSRLANDNPTSGPGPLTMRISCDMTGGSSGGGWLIKASGGLGFVNSVNSYKYVGGPKANENHMYGPYFGNEALDLFNFTVGRG